jgi:hypothetical protein
VSEKQKEQHGGQQPQPQPQQQHPAPDPLHAEAQLYQRIEQARTQIAGAVNQAMQETGMPTAIMLEILRGIVVETSLMLERAGRVAGAAAKEQGDKDK